MSDSTRYFQLTPDILVEYNYYELSNAQEQEGDVSDRLIDFDDNSYVVNNAYSTSRTFFWDQNTYPYVIENNGKRTEYYYRNLGNNFVLPVNKSESRFVQCVNSYNSIWNGADNHIKRSENPIFQTLNNSDNGDVLCDNFRLHFTSRNYLGNSSYDGFIITIQIYDKLKNKIGLLSHYIRKTDDPNINESPVIINQKLYTSHMDFAIPNVYALLNSDLEWVNNSLNGSETTLKNALTPKYELMDNTPIVMSIYGVKSTVVGNNNYEYYNVEKLNSIYIPIIDKSNNCTIKIVEASDGDYFEIYPELKNNRISFSDYVYNMSVDENGVPRPELYIVFHELTLTEIYEDNLGREFMDTTHREQFIINAKNDENENTNVDENELDRHIYFRPVLRHSGKIVGFIIDVKTNIINTLDNTTTVMKGSLQYGVNDGKNAKKYGKKMNRINLGDVPAQVNVYNKKPDIDIDGVKITNASSNVKIENHQHSVIGFIECANVGVSIEQVPTEQLQ